MFLPSELPDHVLRFAKNENLYHIVRDDKSFGLAPAFFFIENISYVKKRFTTGEYLILKEDTPFAFILRMFNNDSCFRKITFPEGYTVQRIVQKLNETSLLSGEICALPQEGSLLPETYYYKFNDTRQSLINRMQREMKLFLEKIENNTSLTIEQVVSLASIIEKESSISSELPLISSVFHNRLEKKMMLQSDPTVIYALSNGYGKINRKLTRNDLKIDSPCNTYKNRGIPSEAICCPGKKAIQAALSPAKTNLLYFVLNRSGSAHTFANCYKDHLKNVNLARKKA